MTQTIYDVSLKILPGLKKLPYMCNRYHLSLVVRKPVFGFQTRSNTNRAVQSQKMARGLKFGIKEVEGFTVCVAKTKALISSTSLFSHMQNAGLLMIGSICIYMD